MPERGGLDGSATIKVLPEMGDLLVLRAVYTRHQFRPHFHDTFLIGVTESGAEAFEARGGRHISPAGRLRFFNPGEVHTGTPYANTAWGYQCLYPSPELLNEVAGEGGFRNPWFPSMIVENARLARRLADALQVVQGNASRLLRTTLLHEVLMDLVEAHGGERIDMTPVKPAPRAVSLASAFIAAHATSDFGLHDVARASAMSPYHLSRAFKAATGLTLFEFRAQIRIDRARDQLRLGRTVGDVAVACGFVDRSHLSHAFRSRVGVSPAAYKAAARHARVQ